MVFLGGKSVRYLPRPPGNGMVVPDMTIRKTSSACQEPPVVTVGTRPMRADGLRNRALVLDAAVDLFAEQGLKVPIEEIAQHAGVGVGTVCRHFPTKEALIDAALSGMWE